MNIYIKALIMSAGLFAANIYAMDDMQMGPSAKEPAKEPAKVITGTGTVVSVKKSANNVTLKHDPIQALQWPAMTMNFKVKDQAELEKLEKGDKVKFTLVPKGNDYLIESIKK